MASHQHDRDHPHHQSHGGQAPRRTKPIVLIGVILMLIALLAYVLTMDEALAPGEQGEAVPAAN
jgi:hypothetical protein